MESKYLKDAYSELYRSIDFIRKVHQNVVEDHEKLKAEHREYMLMNENLKKEREGINSSYAQLVNDYSALKGVEADLANTNGKLIKEASELKTEIQNLEKQKQDDYVAYQKLLEDYLQLKGLHIGCEQLKNDLRANCTCGVVSAMLPSSSD